MNDPVWDGLTVIGSEVMAYNRVKNIAGTFDLVVKFPDGTYGIADLKTKSSEKTARKPPLAQLGAGVEMVGDHFRDNGMMLVMKRCLTIWALPGRTIVETHNAQECLDAWQETADKYALDYRPF